MNSSSGLRQTVSPASSTWRRCAVPEAAGPFRPVDILRALADHRVDFVLIGGLAAVVHGSPYATVDVDIVPRRGRANLAKLSEALRALDARVYVSAGETFRFEHDARSLEDAVVWNLATTYGGLDITFEPAATSGYSDLAERATLEDVGGVDVLVAALEDIVRSKSAAGREKDVVVLPALRRLLELDADARPAGRTTRTTRRARPR